MLLALLFLFGGIVAFLFICAVFAGIIFLFVLERRGAPLDLLNVIAKYIFNAPDVIGF